MADTSDSKDFKLKSPAVHDRTSDSKDVKPKLPAVDDKTSDSKDVKLKSPAVDDKAADSKDVKLKGPGVDDKGKGKQCSNDDDLGISLNKLSLGPKKKLLVLCFGGLLVDRVHLKEKRKVRGLRPDVTYGNFLVFKRPFCTEFLKFCFQRFDVAFWSSALERNIDGVLDTVVGGEGNKFVFVWGQCECTDSEHYCLVKTEKPLFVKQLKRIWEHKNFQGKYSSSNTLLIDDEPHTALLNPPNTAIFPQPYKKHNARDTFLAPNGELREYLEGLVDANDVQSYVKNHPFGQAAINEQHPDWDFYKNVITNFGKPDYSSDDYYSE